MSTVDFAQVVFLQQHKDELQQLKDDFIRCFCDFSKNTLHQMYHPDVVFHGYDLMEYVQNGDLTPTSVKQIKDYMDEVVSIDNSPEFKKLSELCVKLSKLVSKI